MTSLNGRLTLSLAALWCAALPAVWTPAGAQEPQYHAPITAEKRDFSPRPYTYVEPQPLALPSAEELKTVRITGRRYDIRRVPAAAKLSDEAVQRDGIALYDKADEALVFKGSGGAGRRSRERLIIEDCTFVVDFQEGDFSTWNPLRCGVFVTGYNEVIVRNCAFLVKGRPGEPVRRTMASIGIYDTRKVLIEDCHFEGLTNWMRGHVTIFDSGAVTIRRCEVQGSALDGGHWSGGGLWVANGAGEGKLGSAQDEANAIYPSGPLLIEDCYVHDQKGDENTDGIYIQSIHPYLVRNCRVENWGKDGLLDLGFRDSARGTYNGLPLVNHGAIGIVENCEFGGGYVKCSVGLGGGLIFRNNRLRDVWLYPYVFDGGSWYVLGNSWTGQSSVLLSGRDAQTSGWSAKEGMFVNGSRMLLYGNTVENDSGAPKTLLVSSTAKTSNLKETVVSDYNVYRFKSPVTLWADDQGQKVTYPTLQDWRATGNDAHSVVGAGDARALARAGLTSLKLPGGVSMDWNAPVGPTGPIGVSRPEVLARAQELSRAFAAEYAAGNRRVEMEGLAVKDKSAALQRAARTWASGGAYVTFDGKKEGDAVTFTLSMPAAGRYYLLTEVAGDRRNGIYQLLVNGAPVGGPADFSRRGTRAHGVADVVAGDNSITYRAVGKVPAATGYLANLDALILKDPAGVEAAEEAAREAEAGRAGARAERERIDALKIKIPIASLTVVGRTQSWNYPVKGGEYKLWQAKGAGDSIALQVPVERAGRYAISLRTSSQTAGGTLALIIDGKEAGRAALEGQMRLGTVELPAGTSTFTFKLVSPENARDVKVRFLTLELLPAEAAAATP